MVADEEDHEVDTKWITEPTLFDEVNDFSIKGLIWESKTMQNIVFRQSEKEFPLSWWCQK